MLKGFVKDAYGVYKKPLKKELWVNVFVSKKTGNIDEQAYADEQTARDYAYSNGTWIFVKTLHLAQQYTVPWRDEYAE